MKAEVYVIVSSPSPNTSPDTSSIVQVASAVEMETEYPPVPFYDVPFGYANLISN